MNTISRHMKMSEIKEILKLHGVETGYGWEIMLWMTFNGYQTDELVISGYGSTAILTTKEVICE